MKKLIPILLIIAIMVSPAFARNSKMKGKDNTIIPPQLRTEIKSIRNESDFLLLAVGKLVEILQKHEADITKLEEQLDYMETRIRKLEESHRLSEESEYPIFTAPNKYNFNEAE